MPDLLIELYSEEMPARMQARAQADFKRMMTDGLVEAGLTYRAAQSFVTPRRLVLMVEGLSAQSPSKEEERKGPRVGAPDKAVEGFLRASGVTREALQTREDKKGNAVYIAKIQHAGRSAEEIIAERLEASIRNFPWPKTMRWGDGALRWVRPLRSILCILQENEKTWVVPFEIEGIKADDQTRGHPFMAPDAFAIRDLEHYQTALKSAYVVLESSERQNIIRNAAQNIAFANGLEWVEDAALLQEVAGLVEWPVVLFGKIDPMFLELPSEVLQTSMRTHQKFFSLKNPKTDRIEGFITVANRSTKDEGATILRGNQKVLNARLADAAFFWNNDVRVAHEAGLLAWGARLRDVTFHNKLGSLEERVTRIARLAHHLAPQVGADPVQAQMAAQIAKADLTSQMVYEFPELQGVMGRYYAQATGFAPEIAAAAAAHYAPLGPGDHTPQEPISVCVALADKLDLLASFWAIDEKPTGSKDPFALRRAALGVIRLILENNLRLTLRPLIQKADARADVEDLMRFMHERLKVYLRDRAQRHDVIDAALAMPQNDDLTRVSRVAASLGAFLGQEDGKNLLQGFKRANNIVSQAEAKDKVEYSYGADLRFAETEEEKQLFAALGAQEEAAKTALASEDFDQSLREIAKLRAPIDAFFEKVTVNAESDVLRRNRLNLLHQIRQTCTIIADLNMIQGD